MDISHNGIDRLVGISQALAGHTDPGAAFRATAREIAGLICYDHIDIALMLPDRKMHMVYEVGPRTSWSNMARHPLPTEYSPARLVMQEQEPFILTADALSDSRFHFRGALDEPIYTAQLRSRIIVPMRTRGDIVGSLNISRQVADCYTQADVDIAQICADLLTPYISALIHAQEARRAMLAERKAQRRTDMLRVGASQLTENMDRENNRLAMDLHDQTLADLARIARHIAALQSNGIARREELSELEQLVSGCLTELRRVIDHMQPNLLQLFGMRDALDAHLSKSIRHLAPPVAGTVVDLTEGDIDNIPGSARTALYRIAQEAINNATRHAMAKAIDIVIDRTETSYKISIADDGCGIRGHKDNGGGLRHMRTRATLIGATLRYETHPLRKGTRVLVEFNRPESEDCRSARAQEASLP